jgi:hypothetical protein
VWRFSAFLANGRSFAVTHRAFTILLILLAVALALSANSGPGAMIGFLFALVVVMPGGAIGATLDQAGGPVTSKELAWIVAGLYMLLVLVAAMKTWRRFRHRDLNAARSAGLRLALLLTLPLMAWLSLNSMMGVALWR